MTQRYRVVTDGLTYRPCLDRRYAVIDTAKLADNYFQHPWVLQTDDARRANDYADDLNRQQPLRTP